ncbi:MAG: PIN domain-containing protein [Microbacterium sp.]|uniref:PIN domain-containing protein n=1 Tax=Microbacterium sp. TaxID=51671 RepID=UPI0039E46A03
MTLFLVDNSVIQRIDKPQVRDAWMRLHDRGEIATCLPLLLEAGYSARSKDDYERLIDLEQRAKVVLPPSPEIVEIALDLQHALFGAGMGRAVGVSDLQIAATALYHSTGSQPVVVLHYDADFDHLVAVAPRLRVEWIVPRGAIDEHGRADQS